MVSWGKRQGDWDSRGGEWCSGAIVVTLYQCINSQIFKVILVGGNYFQFTEKGTEDQRH